MPKPPDVRVRSDVRSQTRATVENGQADISDTTRARVCVCVVGESLVNSIKNPTPQTPLFDVRLSNRNGGAGFDADIRPDMLTFRMSEMSGRSFHA